MCVCMLLRRKREEKSACAHAHWHGKKALLGCHCKWLKKGDVSPALCVSLKKPGLSTFRPRRPRFENQSGICVAFHPTPRGERWNISIKHDEPRFKISSLMLCRPSVGLSEHVRLYIYLTRARVKPLWWIGYRSGGGGERKFDVPPIAAKRLLSTPWGVNLALTKIHLGSGISFEAEMRLRDRSEMKVIECVLLKWLWNVSPCIHPEISCVGVSGLDSRLMFADCHVCQVGVWVLLCTDTHLNSIRGNPRFAPRESL